MNKESIKKIICYKMGLIAFLILLDFTSTAQNNKQDSIHGTIIIDRVPLPPPDSIKVYAHPDTMPKFNGNMQKYFSDNIRYPEDAKGNKIQGKVYLTVIIEKDGSISNITILKSSNSRLTEEAKRVVSMMPKWIPGKQNGKNIRTQYLICVPFKFPNKSVSPISDSAMKQ